jgi:flavin-dependent dehydrogenase
MKKVIALSTLLALSALGMACGDAGANNAAANNKGVANAMNAAANAANTAANTVANAANTVANAAKRYCLERKCRETARILRPIHHERRQDQHQTNS